MMISGVSLLLLLTSAVCVHYAGEAVTDCEACSKDATCQNFLEGAKDINPTCSCATAFAGDGISCYNRTACDNGDCCYVGFHWSSELGCVDIDECASSEEACPPLLICENTLGSFNCRIPRGEATLPGPNDAPSGHQRSGRSANQNPNSVLFKCGDVMCLAGQDCLIVDASQQCTDPCIHNTAITDAWRSTDFSPSKVKCDMNIDFQNQWYRLFLGKSSVQMPEWCIPKFKCGTHAPLWLPDGHPELADGIVLSRVCGHWGADCCYFTSNPIHVKACPGNYFVYKFVQPSGCNLAYCSDANTAVCGTCRQYETCVSEDKMNWRCEGQAFQAPRLVCGWSFMQVELDKAHLAARGLDVSSAHLADFRCTALNESDGMVLFQMERKSGNCGTMLKTNDTHAIYSNSIFVYPVTDGNVTFSFPERIAVSCVYPLDSNTSLDVAVIRELSQENAVVGVGARPKAVMNLFHYDNYTDPYYEEAVVLPLGCPMYVGVSAVEADSDRFSVILENCYATPSADRNDPTRFSLIQNRCPSYRRLVKVETSGPSLPGRFTVLENLFSGDYDHIFLHCSVGRLKAINRNVLRLAADIHDKGLVPNLQDSESAIVRRPQGSAVSVMVDDNILR
ncbi:hypothetical protein GJAV_G00265150 [Gymnothorax javanicus]|nr:hypothetical protein GJAV_G00265150 [Gymnothorax javanicus]